MQVSFKLHGWADSITPDYKPLFPIRLALYEFWGDADCQIEYEELTKIGYVYKPFKFSVIAKRVCGSGYKNNKLISRTWERISFEAKAKDYSNPSIYEACKEQLKKVKIVKIEEKFNVTSR